VVTFLEGNDSCPARLSEQQERVSVGDDPDFMPLNLVVAPAFVLGARGSQALLQFRLGVRAMRPRRAQLKLAFVVVEVIVNTVEFAPQVTLLPGADVGKIAGQVLGERGTDPVS
jgi:hypothetical protein